VKGNSKQSLNSQAENVPGGLIDQQQVVTGNADREKA
jgi:hypothetical protein